MLVLNVGETRTAVAPADTNEDCADRFFFSRLRERLVRYRSCIMFVSAGCAALQHRTPIHIPKNPLPLDFPPTPFAKHLNLSI